MECVFSPFYPCFNISLGSPWYIVVKALENGVNIIGLTSGKDTKFHHTEKLDKGEVFLAQFTDVTTAIKINGAAEIYTKHGKLMSDAR